MFFRSRFTVAMLFLSGSPLVAAGCGTKDRKFVSGTNTAGSPTEVPEAGVDTAPEVETLPLCPPGASCDDTGCTDDRQCAAPTRCAPDLRRCIGCVSNADCSSKGGLCRTSDGVCVECLNSDAQCGDPMRPRCEVASGTCVACLDDSQCLAADAARCELGPTAPTRFACVGCSEDAQCDGKPGLGPICRTRDGVCTECLSNADCANDADASRCAVEGQCARCENDGDCALLGNRLHVCLPAASQNRCVECSDNSHCVGSDIGAVCKTSNAGAANGPGAINACVECVSNSDCTDPSASRCVQNACVPCTTNADCSALPNLGICDLSGGANGSSPQCVECTGLQFQACANGTNVCNSLTRQCTNLLVGSAGFLCAACVSDAHCDIDMRCVRERVGSTDHFCFPAEDPTCTVSFPFSILTTGTIDNLSQTTCTLGRTSCEGFLDFGRQSCEEDSRCGLPDVADGICVSTEFQGNLCTIPCLDELDCSGGPCSGGVCAL